jgi:chemotaxis protein methyltransferase CheR
VNAITNPADDHLTPEQFRRLAAFIETTSGIRMPPTKKTMVEGRLRRRVRALGLAGMADYCRLLFDEDRLEEEGVHLIDAVSTNKTDFFREEQHFDYLAAHAVPDLLQDGERPLKIWSAACSIGAEPYTIAIVLHEQRRSWPGLSFSIAATDICTEVLEKARLGIYPAEMIAPVPDPIQHRHFLRPRNPENRTMRVAPHIRQSVHFGRLNLMELEYPIGTDMDVIFCRNILFYFDKARQEAVLRRLCRHLRPGGYLFISHTETIAGMDLPLQQVATSVFVRRAERRKHV